MAETQMTFPWPTIHGYDLYDVLSAFQKSIRRGLEEDALYWGVELYSSRYDLHAWQRVLIIASEDIGVADSSVFVLVDTLHRVWQEHRQESSSRLFFVHAVLSLVRAPKSRIVDHATMLFFSDTVSRKDVPDWALDKHTARGRAMRRGEKHFFDEGAQLQKCLIPDPYEVRARKVKNA